MDSPKRILVIQLKRAGDVIVTTPILPVLRKRLPDSKIDFLVDRPFASLLDNNPNVDHVQIYDRKAVWGTWKKLRAASYDWILDFQSSPRSIMAGLYSGASMRAGYRVRFWGKFFTRSMKRPGANISATEGKMNLVRQLLSDVPTAGDRKLFLTESERAWAIGQMGQTPREKNAVGLIPTHRRDSRRWPAASFVHLGKQWVSEGNPLWLFWGPGEEEYVRAIQNEIPGSKMIPNTSLRQMAALLEQCKIVITNDNGPMHLAVAVGTPTLTVYGPTDPKSWNPGGAKNRIVQAQNLSCLGCNMNECPFEHECMTWITPDLMLAQAKSLMNSQLAFAQ